MMHTPARVAWVSLLALAGCGGSEDKAESTPPPKATATGYFLVDGPVEGIRFRSGGQTGYTGRNGELTYEAGTAVTLALGANELGTYKFDHLPVVTPRELTTDKQVRENIVRTVQAFGRRRSDGPGIAVTRTADGVMTHTMLDLQTTDLQGVLGPALREAGQLDGVTYALPDLASANTRYFATLKCMSLGYYKDDYYFYADSRIGSGFFFLAQSTLHGEIWRTYEQGSTSPVAIFEQPQTFDDGPDFPFTAHAPAPPPTDYSAWETTDFTGHIGGIGKITSSTTTEASATPLAFDAAQFLFPNPARTGKETTLPQARFVGIVTLRRQYPDRYLVENRPFVLDLMPDNSVRALMADYYNMYTYATVFRGQLTGTLLQAKGWFHDFPETGEPLYTLTGTLDRKQLTLIFTIYERAGAELLSVDPLAPIQGCEVSAPPTP